MKLKFALALACFVLATNLALAGGPIQPPGPMAQPACAGGNSVLGYTTYGTPLVCGTALATGSIANGTSQLGYYIGANSIGPLTPSGDVSFSAPNFTVTGLNGVALGTTTATGGNMLIGSGTQWVTHPLSGDATLSAGGALTIAASAITNAKLANPSVTLNTHALALGGSLTLGFPDFSGQIAGTQMPALTGDVTSLAGSSATTIASGAVSAGKLAAGAASSNIGTVGGALAGNMPNPTLSSTVLNVVPKGTGSGLTTSALTDNGSGVTVGSPTGGPQGANSLNVANGIYINGVAVGTGSGSITGLTTGQIPVANGPTSVNASVPYGTAAPSALVQTDSNTRISNTLISGLPNASLANPSVTVNSHTLALGGALNLAFADLGGQVTGAQIASSTVANANLVNPSVTLNSHSLALGNSLTLGFGDFSGQIAGSQMPAAIGDIQRAAGSAAEMVTGIQGHPVLPVTPTDKQILQYNAAQGQYQAVNPPVSGINQLTGAVTTPQGTGTQIASITPTGVAAGSYSLTTPTGSACLTVSLTGQITSMTASACAAGGANAVGRNGGGTVGRNGGGSVGRNG